MSTDALPTAQLNGVAWAQLVVGNTVYVGGSFSQAQPAGAASGVSTVSRSNMLAYNLSTGALLGSFAPSFNGEVRALAASADGSTVYAGGAFTTVNGVARNRLVALNAATGAVVGGFAPSVNSNVFALTRSGNTLYFGGWFTAVSGTPRSRAAAVSASNGALAPWAPAVGNNTVRGLVVNPEGTRVVLAGSFDTLNGVGRPYAGTGMVDAQTGQTNLPWSAGAVVLNHGPDAAILDLSTDGSSVYGVGYVYGATNGSNLEGMFSASWATGAIRWVEDCHGDSYASFPLNGAVYVASHSHYCGNIGGFPETNPRTHHRGLAFTTGATGVVSRNTVGNYASFTGTPAPSLLNWYPDFNTGTYTGQGQGPWSVAAGGNYVVYGGEFTSVNGKRQQGLVRFALPAVAPNADGPRLSGADLRPALSVTGASVRVSWTSDWDRDNQQLTYRLYRGSTLLTTVTGLSTFWNRPALTFTDSGARGAVSYTVTATDPWGNTVVGSPASITAAGAGSPPVAAFTSATDGLNATMDGRPSSDPDGAIVSYAWTFGDDGTAAGATATHRYQTAGSYPVTLTVTDDSGATDSETANVTVSAGGPAVVARDGFGRTVAAGLGDAEVGGAYAVTGTASSYGVDGTTARLLTASGSTKTASLRGATATDADLTATVRLSALPAGGSVYTDLIARSTAGGDYRARVVVNPAGGVQLYAARGSTGLEGASIASLLAGPTTVLRVRVQAIGASPSTVRAKVWRDGDDEPGPWQVSAADSTAGLQSPGSVGFSTYLSSSATNGPIAVSIDDLLAVESAN